MFLSVTLIGQQVHIVSPLVEMPGCSTVSDLYSVAINNFDNEQIPSLMEFEISYQGASLNQGIVARGMLTSSPRFVLNPGLTQITSGNVDDFFPSRFIEFFDDNLENIQRSSSCLPPGEYSVCIRLFGVDAIGEPDLSNKISETCFVRTKTNTNNIFLISPFDKEKVSLPLPIFSWTPIADFGNNSTYILELVEVFDHQTAFEAFRSNPIFYSISDLQTNSFQYPIVARAFDPCRRYAWRVGFYNSSTFTNQNFVDQIEPTVFSEVWEFMSFCGLEIIDSQTKVILPTLVQPSEGGTINNNLNVSFIWNHLINNNSLEKIYKIHIVEKNDGQSSRDAFLQNESLCNEIIRDENYFFWQESLLHLELEKEYVWGVIPLNSDGGYIFNFDELEYNLFSIRPLSTNILLLCPYRMDPFTVVSQYFDESIDSWIVEVNTPQDNAASLTNNPLTYELDGESFEIPPFFSDYIFSTDNTDLNINVINQNANTITLSINSSSQSYSDFDLCIRKTFTLGDFDCGDQECIPLNFEEQEESEDCSFDGIVAFELSNMSFSTNSFAESDLIKAYFNPRFNYTVNRTTEYVADNYRIKFNTINVDPQTILKYDAFSNVQNKDKHVIGPDWSSILAEGEVANRELISFEVEACLYVDFKNEKGDVVCTDIECITIEHLGNQVEESLACDVNISSLEKQGNMEYRASQLTNDGYADAFYIQNIDHSTGMSDAFIAQNPSASLVNTIHVETIESNVELNFELLSDKSIAVNPVWFSNEVVLEDEIKFEIQVCLISKAIENGEVLCSDEKCLKMKHEGENWEEVNEGAICEIEISSFSPSGSPQYQSSQLGNNGYTDAFYIQDFNFQTEVSDLFGQENPNHQIINNIHLEIIESNIDLSFREIEFAKYAIEPVWFSNEFISEDEINFELQACMNSQVQIGDEIICSQQKCVPLSFVGRNYSDQSTLATNTDCPIDFQFDLTNDEAIFREDIFPYLHFYYDIESEVTIEEGQEGNIEVKYDFDYNVISSNVGLTCYINEEDEIIVHPNWYLNPEFTELNVAYEIEFCYWAEVYDAEGLLCIQEYCKTLNLDSDPCKLDVKIKKSKDNLDLYTFEANLKNQDKNSEFNYSWEFSNGDTSTEEATIAIFEDPGSETVTLTVSGLDKNGKQCEATDTKSIRIRPGCDWEACEPSCDNPLSANPKKDDKISLCGGLILILNDVNGTSANLTGQGTVRVPWLLSDILVEFNGISINSNYEFCHGELNAVKYDNAPAYPEQWGINAAFDLTENAIRDLNEHLNSVGGVLSHIPEDAVIDAVEDQVNPLKVPIGFTNVPINLNDQDEEPKVEDKTKYTLGIAALRLTPNQNYIKAIAAVDFSSDNFPGNGDATLLFESDHFFFNSSGPILSTGNSPDFKFEITKPTTLQYGTNNGDPLFLTFNDSESNEGWGTSLGLTSECNEPYKFCLSADIDIEFPRSWVTPIEDPVDTAKVAANTKIEICNFKDFITQISLPNCYIANAEGTELEVQELTWDNSSTRNADNFEFPDNYDETGISEQIEEFKGFYLKTAKVLLPEDISTYDDQRRIEISLSNWIFHKGFGVCGTAYAENLVNFPNMNVSDLGASLDTFKFEMVNNSITEAKLIGEITLPICDSGGDDTSSKLNFEAMYGTYPENSQITSGLLFLVEPKQHYECPFFGNGELIIEKSSRLYVTFQKEHSAIDLTINGALDFPDKEIGPVSLEMKSEFEGISLNYTKYKSENQDDIVLFDHGVWNFASPQKKISKFNFSIENFESVTSLTDHNEFYVGGVGFDAVVNLNDKVGGAAGLKILGSIKKEPEQRLTAGFKGVEIDSVGIYANLSGAKIDGYVKFREDNVWGKAVEGEVNAIFQGADVSVNAGLLFGNKINDPNPFRFMKLEASAMFPDPGIPLAPGFVIRGLGAGFYKNLECSFPSLDDLALSTNSSAFAGASFFPKEGPKGLGLLLVAATSPKSKTFNCDLSLMGDINENGGLSVGIAAKAYGGVELLDRESGDAWLTGYLTGTFDFPEKHYSINAGANLLYDPYVRAEELGLTLDLNGKENTFYFDFGTASDPNTVTFFGGISAKMYLMFGNRDITPPSGWIGDNTRVMMEEYTGTSNFLSRDFDEDVVGFGKGFATGLSIEAYESDKISIDKVLLKGTIDYSFGAGTEFHLNMIDYGQEVSCDEINPIGFNGYYMSANLGAWAYANGGINGMNIAKLYAGLNLNANFPKPWKFNGELFGGLTIGDSIVNLSVTLPIKFGKDCTIEEPTVENILSFEEEDVVEELLIFNEVLINEGDDEVNPEEPLRWTTFFEPTETFYLPEMQQDGQIKSRKIQVQWEANLFEWNDEKTAIADNEGNVIPWPQFDEVEERKIDIGVDPNGRWCLSKEIYKYGNPINVGTSTGTSFDSLKMWIREADIGEVKIGRFNEDQFDDLLMYSNLKNEWWIFLSDGNRFYRTESKLDFLKGVVDFEIGRFDEDELSDFAFVRSNQIVLKFNDGFVENGCTFDQERIAYEFDFGSLSLPGVGDFNGDGIDDFYNVNSSHQTDYSLPPKGGVYPTFYGASFEVLLNAWPYGTTFGEFQIWLEKQSMNPINLQRLEIFDFNGDNRDDFKHNNYIYTSNGYNEFVLQQQNESYNEIGLFYGEYYVGESGFDFNSYQINNFSESDWELNLSHYLYDIVSYDFNLNQNGIHSNNNLRLGSFNDDQYLDVLTYNVSNQPKYKSESEWFPNHLTPNKKYKLELKGWIYKDGILEKEELIIREFTTGSSDRISIEMANYEKDYTYFDPNYIPPINSRPTTISTSTEAEIFGKTKKEKADLAKLPIIINDGSQMNQIKVRKRK